VPVLVEQPDLHRYTIEEYHRLVESGGLDEDTRVELIDGLVLDMSPRSPQHENAVRWLVDWVIDHLDRRRYEQLFAVPLTLGGSEPEPDVAIVARAAPRLCHPSEALLVIEVALRSRNRDLRVKPVVYAAGVAEYWVVDLERRCVVVHRDATEHGYRRVRSVVSGEPLRCAALELGLLPTGELFAAAFAETASA
jgi:Uma2 family endonuclease